MTLHGQKYILYVTDEYLIPNHGHQHANTTALTLLGGFLQEFVAWQQVFVLIAGFVRCQG